LHYKLCKERYGSSGGGKSQLPDLEDYVRALNTRFQDGASQEAKETTLKEFASYPPFSEPSEPPHASEPPVSPSTAQPTTSSAPSPQQDQRQYVAMDVTVDGQMIVAIVTPLMYRVHQLVNHSGEMVFMDATGNVDRSNCRVFLLLTHSCVGGLPLGVFITTSESQSTVKAALQLLQNMVGDVGFFGQGKRGPQIFMTDDCKAEQGALKEVFPQSATLLCAFHVLQAFWRYVWDSKNGVSLAERPHIFHLVKDMLYANSTMDLETKYEAAVRDDKLKKHPKVLAYVQHMFGRRHLWALCHRKDLLVRGNNTNNFCETGMRVLKDRVLNRTKAFNVQQLIDFVSTRMELYYERRCVDVANNVLYRVQQSRFLLPLNDPVDALFIDRVGETDFVVQSTTDPSCHYTVDMSVGLCTCKEGSTGGPCKHQASIVKQFGIESWNFIPDNPQIKQTLCVIGTGQVKDLSWFKSLRDPLSIPSASVPVSAAEGDTGIGEFLTDHPNIKIATGEAGLSDQLVVSGSQTTPSVTTDSETLLSSFDDFVDMVKGKVLENPEYFGPALAAFTRKAGKITTDSHLVSALYTFGNSAGTSLARASSSDKLISSKRISVQPTAVQRRQSVLPGSRFKGVGRPSKDTQACGRKRHQSDECLSASSMPKRKKAPHSLSQCVKENKSLGKTRHQIQK
jgi:hypothetical protein